MTTDPVTEFINKLPPSRINNSRKIVTEIYEKVKKEGKYVGHWSRTFMEMSGIQPADERSSADYGNEYIR